MKNSNTRPILIIDGFNNFIRNMMVNESMNGKSEPIGGVVGFLRFVNSLLVRFTPEQIIVCWETGGASSRRKAMCPSYKANRAKVKELTSSIKDSLRTDTETKAKQLLILNQFLKFTPICQIFIPNTEADDIIGYLAKYYFKKSNNLKLIVSSDKDFYQLLENDNVQIYDPLRKMIIDRKWVEDKYGIATNNFCLARTLEGDKSDNIEGIPGVGLKSVLKRFPAFADPSVEMTIDRVITESKDLLEANKKLGMAKNILDHEDRIKLNWKLMHLDSSNFSGSQIEKIHGAIEMFEPKIDKLGMIKFLIKEQMNIIFDPNEFCSNLYRCGIK